MLMSVPCSFIKLPELKDFGVDRIMKEAAMAKLFAKEAAQCVIEEAIQLFGGSRVVSGFPIGQFYR